MLVLSRKNRESILIGGAVSNLGGITVTVLEIHHGVVKLGIEADPSIPILRSEVGDRRPFAPSPDSPLGRRRIVKAR